MADLLIRDIDPETKHLIEMRAKAHDRSLSDEAKLLVKKALALGPEPVNAGGAAGFGNLMRRMVDDIGGAELELPSRAGIERPLPNFS